MGIVSSSHEFFASDGVLGDDQFYMASIPGNTASLVMSGTYPDLDHSTYTFTLAIITFINCPIKTITCSLHSEGDFINGPGVPYLDKQRLAYGHLQYPISGRQ